MTLTLNETELLKMIGARCKSYNFFVSIDKRMFMHHDQTKEVTRNQLRCMLRNDLKDKTPVKGNRLSTLIDFSIEALIRHCQSEIRKTLEPLGDNLSSQSATAT